MAMLSYPAWSTIEPNAELKKAVKGLSLELKKATELNSPVKPCTPNESNRHQVNTVLFECSSDGEVTAFIKKRQLDEDELIREKKSGSSRTISPSKRN